MASRIRSASAAFLFLVTFVALTSAFNLPSRSRYLSPQLTSLKAAKPVQHRTTLTFLDRVAYQRAIEEVYWRHRIWPKENVAPKPPLDAVMSQAQIEKKVEDYLRNSQALEDYWQRPITPDQLQAEMERIASHTKQPGVLREIFAALGNDPSVIAECLARPALEERLAADRRGGSAAPRAMTRKAEGQAFFVASQLDLPSSRGLLDPPSMLMETQLGNAAYKLPEIRAPLDCTDDTWTPTSLTNAPGGRTFHTAVWTGSEMIVWGGVDVSGYLNTGGRYNPTTDSWTATSTASAPDGREIHTAVWTGSEMIIWGGYNGSDLNTGGKYNPGTDSWTATSTTNAPTARDSHTAVWTGSKMIVWGGFNSGSYFNTGGRYDPSTDNWAATSTTGAPNGRASPTAVWGGNEMIVWGGFNSSNDFNTGGRYNPGTDSWMATSTTKAPDARDSHTAISTGSEMIVWGGETFNFNLLNTGGRYNPGTDSWIATSTAGAPAARDDHTAVWTGSQMIVWGGFGGSFLSTGGRYNPSTDSWTATSTTSAPAARDFHTAVWTGSQMIVWGGAGPGPSYFNTGGRYCAQTAPMAQSAFSRKTQGAAGTFDIPLPLTGNVGIECRTGPAYQMIVNFASNVTVESASVTSGTGMVTSFTGNGTPTITVNLTGVINIQRITMTLHNVNDGTHTGDVPVSMGVLIGDTTGNGVVNAGDVSQTKSQVGQTVTMSNFREDVNASGTITATDVAIVKSDVGTSLPP